jgi:hypothetical protein
MKRKNKMLFLFWSRLLLVLGGGKRGEGPKGAPSSWEWRGQPEDSLYSALYPRAWTVYNITQVPYIYQKIERILKPMQLLMPRHSYSSSTSAFAGGSEGDLSPGVPLPALCLHG